MFKAENAQIHQCPVKAEYLTDIQLIKGKLIKPILVMFNHTEKSLY